MPSYNEIDRDSIAQQCEIVDRNPGGRSGDLTVVVVSDYFGIDELRKLHHVVSNKEDAARMALDAGVDIELPFPDAYTFVDWRKLRPGESRKGAWISQWHGCYA